jgi:hypothetical protein
LAHISVGSLYIIWFFVGESDTIFIESWTWLKIFLLIHVPKSDISGSWTGNTVLTTLLSCKIQPDFLAWLFMCQKWVWLDFPKFGSVQYLWASSNRVFEVLKINESSCCQLDGESTLWGPRWFLKGVVPPNQTSIVAGLQWAAKNYLQNVIQHLFCLAVYLNLCLCVCVCVWEREIERERERTRERESPDLSPYPTEEVRTWFNYIFTGRQPHHRVNMFQHFRDWQWPCTVKTFLHWHGHLPEKILLNSVAAKALRHMREFSMLLE